MHIILNGQTRSVPDGASIADLLRELKLDARQVAVEVNEQLAPRATHQEHRLAPDDRLEVVTLVGGG